MPTTLITDDVAKRIIELVAAEAQLIPAGSSLTEPVISHERDGIYVSADRTEAFMISINKEGTIKVHHYQEDMIYTVSSDGTRVISKDSRVL